MLTETVVAITAMMIALLVAFGTAVVITAVSIARRDWQRERASLNCEAGRSHRLDRIHQKPRL